MKTTFYTNTPAFWWGFTWQGVGALVLVAEADGGVARGSDHDGGAAVRVPGPGDRVAVQQLGIGVLLYSEGFAHCH